MTLQQPHLVASKGFQNEHNNYALSRPRYPIEAIDYIRTLIPAQAKVVDLGAGTGIMTKFLVEQADFQVTAVEPVAGMRDQLQQSVPGVTLIDGTAWDTTLPSESYDAVIVAQAFHWFDDLKSLKEIHRILKPGGQVLLIWNMESKKARWVEELRNLYEVYDGAAPQYRLGYWKKVWETDEAQTQFNTPLQHQRFDYNMPFAPDKIFPRILSKSYIAILPKEEQASLEKNVKAVLDDPSLGFAVDPHSGLCIYPHDTDLYWCSKK